MWQPFIGQQGSKPLWTGGDADDLDRRRALLHALEKAEMHGLPAVRYDKEELIRKMREARSTRDLGFLEIELTRTFLNYARDMQTGALVPAQIDAGIVREVPYRDRSSYLISLERSDDPVAFMAGLVPGTKEYRALLKQKLHLERLVSEGGWGPKVRASSLEPGDQGTDVVALRGSSYFYGIHVAQRQKYLRCGHYEGGTTLSVAPWVGARRCCRQRHSGRDHRGCSDPAPVGHCCA